MRKRSWVLVCLVVFVGFVASAYAQFAKPEEAIEFRKSKMTLMAYQFKKLAAVIKGTESYNADAFSADVEVFKTLVDMPWDAYTAAGSDKGHTTMNSKAFKEPDAFNAEVKVFMTATDNLMKAAKSGDLKSAKAPFGETAKGCKACHGEYRNK